jgi:PPOX class probable FMN-dependent enzyme
MPLHTISSQAQLRSLYASAGERALAKELTFLDPHCQRFVQLSPFLVLGSSNTQGQQDATPRGGEPGFVKVLNEHTLLLPDASGNNRLDSLSNIIETSQVGLLFMLPGVDETLRINGRASLSIAPEHLQVFAADKKPPKLVVVITVAQAYLHCAKALMRSRLWATQSQVARSVLPTMGKMIGDQMGVEFPPETQEQMVARYQQDL